MTLRDGLKRVSAYLIDQAGNQSDVSIDQIVLDTQSPQLVNFQIESWREYTAQPIVAIEVNCSDNQATSSVLSLSISGDSLSSFSA